MDVISEIFIGGNEQAVTKLRSLNLVSSILLRQTVAKLVQPVTCSFPKKVEG